MAGRCNSSSIEEQWSELIEELFALQHDQGADGKLKPAMVRLSTEAVKLFADYVDVNRC